MWRWKYYLRSPVHPLRTPLNYPSRPGLVPPSMAEVVVGIMARVMTSEVTR